MSDSFWSLPVQASCPPGAPAEVLPCPHSAEGRGDPQDMGHLCTPVTHPAERALELALLTPLSPDTEDWVRLSAC